MSIRELSLDEINGVNGGVVFLAALPAFYSGLQTGAVVGGVVGTAAGLIYKFS